MMWVWGEFKEHSRGFARFFVFYTFFFFVSRDNFLVLDIFFEALNYETIEQKKAYDVAGLLGKKSACSPFF